METAFSAALASGLTVEKNKEYEKLLTDESKATYFPVINNANEILQVTKAGSVDAAHFVFHENKMYLRASDKWFHLKFGNGQLLLEQTSAPSGGDVKLTMKSSK